MTDYREIAERLEANNHLRFVDGPHIMELLGYETKQHRRLGLACRPKGESHWQSLPHFHSADDFDTWVLGKFGGELIDIGLNDERDGERYVSYQHEAYGNDYGYGQRLGTAMWGAFVRLVGEVVRPEDV